MSPDANAQTAVRHEVWMLSCFEVFQGGLFMHHGRGLQKVWLR